MLFGLRCLPHASCIEFKRIFDNNESHTAYVEKLNVKKDHHAMKFYFFYFSFIHFFF